MISGDQVHAELYQERKLKLSKWPLSSFLVMNHTWAYTYKINEQMHGYLNKIYLKSLTNKLITFEII